MIILIPSGVKNLKLLFPAIDWNSVEEYYVELYADTILSARSNNFLVEQCKEEDSRVRIHFLNSLGLIDSITMYKDITKHEAKSETYEKRRTSTRSSHGISRTNVRSNDTTTCLVEISEEDVEFYEEVSDSPLAWIEAKGKQGLPDDYIPIIISDHSFEKFHKDDRYYYEFTLEFKLSHEKLIIRN